MSNYTPKSKGFLNFISKRIEILVGIVYLYLVQKIAYPLNFQQMMYPNLKLSILSNFLAQQFKETIIPYSPI